MRTPLPADDSTQSYSLTELQQLLAKTVSDAPSPEDCTRQYAAEDWDKLRRSSRSSDAPKSEKAADAAAGSTNDTIPDTEELTRVYIRPNIEDSERPKTPPEAQFTNTGRAEHDLPDLLSSCDGDGTSSEATRVAARRRVHRQSMWSGKTYVAFVCLGIAVNIYLWGALWLNAQGTAKVPVWLKSCGAYAHHLYIQVFPRNPVRGR